MPAPKSPLTAQIVEWDYAKGYGYLQVGNQRVFLHIRDFSERHKSPAVGDRIQFAMGADAKGRPCARNAVHVNDGGRITVLSWLILASLLVLPVIALQRFVADLLWGIAALIVMSALTFAAYASDKRRARAKTWRLSESSLHLLEMLGGWPGAFLAQRHLRHKCSKPSYQFVFWLIVLAYQFAAFDFLQNWNLSRSAWARVQSSIQERGETKAPRP